MRRRGRHRGSILKKTDDSHTESEKPHNAGGTLVSKLDIDFMKTGFKEFDVQSKGYLENFELGVFLNCIGMKSDEERVNGILKMLEEKQVKKLDVHGLIQVLHIVKEMEMEEPGDDEDEYLDAFVALGGQTDKSGTIEIDLLREIIKDDFELTISMADYLNNVESGDSMDFY